MKTLIKINRSRYAVLLVLAAVFFFMLYCNILSPLKGDDFCYMDSFKEGAEIENIWDIFISMYHHRFTTNGRVIPHFFVQLFLIFLPLPVFKLINALMFTALVWLIYSFSRRDKEHNAMIPLVTMCFLWTLTLEFGSVCLWLDGSVNYLWCVVVLLCWLVIMARDFQNDIHMKPWQEILFCLFSLAVGNYAENSSVAAVFMMMLFIALSLFYKKRPLKRWHISALCSMLLGFFLLAFAPAEAATKIAHPSLNTYINNFVVLSGYYLQFWPLLLIYALAFVRSLRTESEWHHRLLSLIILGGSLAAHYVLSFAPFPTRTPVLTSFCLLILACSTLAPALEAPGLRPVIALCCAVLFSVTAYRVYVGVQDLRLVNYKWNYNDQLIKEKLAAGERDILVPYIIPDTEYSCLYLWGYLREDPRHYNNLELAEYYGADSINGYWFYD